MNSFARAYTFKDLSIYHKLYKILKEGETLKLQLCPKDKNDMYAHDIVC